MKAFITLTSLLALLLVTASAHDMFLKFDSYFLKLLSETAYICRSLIAQHEKLSKCKSRVALMRNRRE